jgi:hypothetical protein
MRLIVSPGLPDEQEFILKTGPNSIGRARDNDIVILDQSLSRYHARVDVNVQRSDDSRPNPDGSSANAPSEVSTPVAPRIYEATDRDVSPPKAMTPPRRKAPSLPPGATAIVIVINEGGIVASAHAVQEPQTLSESLQLASILSSVKTWRFRPAMKDGLAVKYRLRLPT